jgi:hypothetical protein
MAHVACYEQADASNVQRHDARNTAVDRNGRDEDDPRPSFTEEAEIDRLAEADGWESERETEKPGSASWMSGQVVALSRFTSFRGSGNRDSGASPLLPRVAIDPRSAAEPPLKAQATLCSQGDANAGCCIDSYTESKFRH